MEEEDHEGPISAQEEGPILIVDSGIVTSVVWVFYVGLLDADVELLMERAE